MKNFQLDMIRVATAVPNICLGNPLENSKEILALANAAEAKNVGILSFPELALTGASCGTLFNQEELYKSQIDALTSILNYSTTSEMLIIVGGYIKIRSSLYNCAFVLKSGAIISIIPKNCNNSPWFSPWISNDMQDISIGNFSSIPVGSNIILHNYQVDFNIGIVLGDDYNKSKSQGSLLSESGAHLIINLACEKSLTGSQKAREEILKSESSKLSCAYMYSSLGPGESSSNCLYAGDSYIVELGQVLAQGKSDYQKGNIVISDIDLGAIQYARTKNKDYIDNSNYTSRVCNFANMKTVTSLHTSFRSYSASPFLPNTPKDRMICGMEIYNIQANALANRMRHTKSEKMVLGVSGGLDSTLALMVAVRAAQMLGKTPNDIIAVTMPGFGTSGQTYQNATYITNYLGVQYREIPIVPACLQHFKDIGKNANQHDITYQNAQARERTQILMDIANTENGLVIGTGDLSEIALGWSTFNGDHISNYNVNAGIPKTVIPTVLEHIANLKEFKALAPVLKAVTETPISPELLPLDPNGNIVQQTESEIGKYELHDFFLYHTIKTGVGPEKLFQMSRKTFGKAYDVNEIKRCLVIFYRRFFSQQFKRNCSPDGPQVNEIFLSPKEFSMASDIKGDIWIMKAENLATK